MTKDELIVRLTRELYDLKQQLEDIRKHADSLYQNLELDSPNRGAIIDIINTIDTGEVYED